MPAKLVLTRGANVIDGHVGARIRLRRRLLGITQEQLARGLGMTFQQVQKYERGSNRVSASKLYETARLLAAPVDYFFDGLTGSTIDAVEAEAGDPVRSFLNTLEGPELARIFQRIQPGRSGGRCSNSSAPLRRPQSNPSNRWALAIGASGGCI